MSELTHGKVKIKDNTAVLINASEVLTKKGIQGDINKVGIGFGTGRHTSGRRVELYEQEATEQVTVIKTKKIKSRKSSPPKSVKSKRSTKKID